jgi:type IV pilus modification protein PilV
MKRRASGVTLIEVLIALVVLVIGLTAATATIIYANRSTTTGMHVEQASTMAQSLLTALLAVPYTSSGTGNSASPNNFFTNSVTGNDTDVADSANAFAVNVLPSTAYDHSDAELPANVLAMIGPATPVPGGITYQRYWNIAPVGSNGVVIAVIVRWHEASQYTTAGSTLQYFWQRTVVVGTRYAP